MPIMPEQPTLIYLDLDENGNITNMLRGKYVIPEKQYDTFVATYDEAIIKADANEMDLSFDNSGLATKVTINVIGGGV